MPKRDLTLYTQFLASSDNLHRTWVSSLDLPMPQLIKVCSRLPIIDHQTVLLPLSDFEAQIASQRGLEKFTWTNSNYLPLAVKEQYEDLIRNYLPPAETIQKLDQYFLNPTPLLIADMGACGYGLFAEKKIKKGSIVCTYTGKLIPSDYHFEGDANRYYTLGVRSNSTLTAVFQADPEVDTGDFEITIDPEINYPAFIDGSAYGNYGSFLQHLPTKASSNEVSTATANLITVGANYKHYPCYYFQASRDIEAHEILGFDYGENYWKGLSIKLVTFDQFGRQY